MESLLFTELTLDEQQNLSGGRRRRSLPVVIQGNVSIIQQQANANAYATGPNSVATATASNFAVVGQTNQALVAQ